MENAADDKKGGSVVEHLQAPRKKRKKFVVLALGKDCDDDLRRQIDRFVATKHGNLSLAVPRHKKDIRRMVGKHVLLMVISDAFIDSKESFDLIKLLKMRHKEGALPVLFLTGNPERIINAYNKYLLPYQESDDYIDYKKTPTNQLLAILDERLRRIPPRRSRRYRVEIPIRFFHLLTDKMYEGNIVDLSLHGGVLKRKGDLIFRNGDQIRVRVPINKYLPPAYGEYIGFAAKVRRVYMGGDIAGVSWEYLSDHQTNILMVLITSMVNFEIHRQSKIDKRTTNYE